MKTIFFEMKKLQLLILFLALPTFLFAQKYYTVDQIPNPKLKGQDYFVSNPDGILNNVETINGLLVMLEQQTKVEFAVVVVNDFEQDQEDFEFAKAIFDKWQIGKAGSNNGLLLFIAKDRRKYRFISGDGVEGLLPDVLLKQVGEQMLVPAFKENRYDEGVINAINEINYILTNPQNTVEIQSLVNNEKQKSFDWQYALGGSALLGLIFFFVFRVFNRQTKGHTALATNPSASAIETKNNKKATTKQSKKKNSLTLADQNGYDAVYTKGCVGIFFFLFISFFLLVFSGGLWSF